MSHVEFMGFLLLLWIATLSMACGVTGVVSLPLRAAVAVVVVVVVIDVMLAVFGRTVDGVDGSRQVVNGRTQDISLRI